MHATDSALLLTSFDQNKRSSIKTIHFQSLNNCRNKFLQSKILLYWGKPSITQTLFTETTLRLTLIWHGRRSCSLKDHNMSFDHWLSVPATGHHSCTLTRMAMVLDSLKPRQANATFPIQHVLWHLRICPIMRDNKRTDSLVSHMTRDGQGGWTKGICMDYKHGKGEKSYHRTQNSLLSARIIN